MNEEEHGGVERFRWLAEGNARQARKRVSAKAVICDGSGRVLLVNPTYKPHWDLPGGMAEANESPIAAVVREVEEELGFTARVRRLLLVDWVDAHGPWDDLLVFVFDAGTVTGEDEQRITVVDEEISEFAFVPLDAAEARLRHDMWLKLARAMAAKQRDAVDYREHPMGR